MFGQFSRVFGSQALLSIVGLATLPIIARNLNPEVFGRFALYTALIGMAALLDCARPILIRRKAERMFQPSNYDEGFIAFVNIVSILVITTIVGIISLPATAAAYLVATCLLHALASPDYADLAVRHGAGPVQLYRNVLWSVAYIVVAVGSYFSVSGLFVFLPFTAASLGIFSIYRLLNEGTLSLWPEKESTIPRGEMVRDFWHVWSFNVVVGFVTVIDKVALQRNVPASTFGTYSGQSSLSLKTNLYGTAVGQTIYPMFARRIEEHGLHDAIENFARVFCICSLALGVIVPVAIWYGRDIVTVVLGPQYSTEFNVFGWFMLGVSLQFYGMVLTPWQRARGDFRTSRDAYTIAATLMLVCAIVLIPRFGVAGAVVTYLAGRIGDTYIFVRELPTLVESAFFRRWALGLPAIQGLAFILLVSGRS